MLTQRYFTNSSMTFEWEKLGTLHKPNTQIKKGKKQAKQILLFGKTQSSDSSSGAVWDLCPSVTDINIRTWISAVRHSSVRVCVAVVSTLWYFHVRPPHFFRLVKLNQYSQRIFITDHKEFSSEWSQRIFTKIWWISIIKVNYHHINEVSSQC